MFDDNEEMGEAIKWFSSMKSEDKALLINNPTSFSEDITEKFIFIVRQIAEALRKFRKDKIVTELVKYGLDQAFAVALVDKIAQEIPPIEYDIRIIKELSDDEYGILLKNLFQIMYFSSATIDNIDKFIENLKIDEGTFNSLRRYISYFLTENINGDYSLEDIDQKLRKSGVSDKKIEMLVEHIRDNRSEIRESLLYQYIYQLLSTELPSLQKTQQKTNQLLEELLNELKKYSSSGEPRGYI